MKAHILINIRNDSTELCYVNTGERVHTHVYEYGYSHGENRANFLQGVMYMLEHINTVENIPTTFILSMNDETQNFNKKQNFEMVASDNPMRHKIHWYKALLESYNYTQFDTEGNAGPCVIIDSDERYKKVNRLGLKV